MWEAACRALVLSPVHVGCLWRTFPSLTNFKHKAVKIIYARILHGKFRARTVMFSLRQSSLSAENKRIASPKKRVHRLNACWQYLQRAQAFSGGWHYCSHNPFPFPVKGSCFPPMTVWFSGSRGRWCPLHGQHSFWFSLDNDRWTDPLRSIAFLSSELPFAVRIARPNRGWSFNLSSRWRQQTETTSGSLTAIPSWGCSPI